MLSDYLAIIWYCDSEQITFAHYLSLQPQPPPLRLDRNRRLHLRKTCQTMLIYFRDSTLGLSSSYGRRICIRLLITFKDDIDFYFSSPARKAGGRCRYASPRQTSVSDSSVSASNPPVGSSSPTYRNIFRDNPRRTNIRSVACSGRNAL